MSDQSVTPVEAPPKELTIVKLGNDAPLMQLTYHEQDPQTGEYRVLTRAIQAKHLNQSVTTVNMQPDFDDQEHVDRALSTDNDRMLALIARVIPEEDKKYAIGISQIEQLFPSHSANSKPAWVDSSDKKFAEALGRYYNCPVGEPVMLLTNGGRDLIHSASFNTAAQPAAANYMALANSATATTPAASDTTLTGEITTAGGGLIRKQATYAHTAGTNTTTLTATFTANGSDSLAVTVSQIGIFNASSSGTMALKTALSSNATLTTSGDNVSVTETITGG